MTEKLHLRACEAVLVFDPESTPRLTGYEVGRLVKQISEGRMVLGMHDVWSRLQQLPVEWRQRRFAFPCDRRKRSGVTVMPLIIWRNGRWRRCWVNMAIYQTESLYVVMQGADRAVGADFTRALLASAAGRPGKPF